MSEAKHISPDVYRNTQKQLEDTRQDLHFAQEAIERLKEEKESLAKIINEKDYEIMALKAKIYDITNRGW